MNRLPGQRVRLRYGKDDVLQYVGHTDVIRLLMRLLQRAEFPYGQSGHFSPKPRIIYSPALPLGISALNELCEIELREDVAWDDAQRAAMLVRLRDLEHPAGLVHDLELIAPDRPNLAQETIGARYCIELEDTPQAWLEALSRPDFGWTRRGGAMVLAAPAIIRSNVDGANLIVDGYAAGPAVFNALASARALQEKTGSAWRKLVRVGLLDAEGALL